MKIIKLLVATCLAANIYAQSAGDLISYQSNLDLTPSGVANFIGSQAGVNTPAELLGYLNSFNVGLRAYRIEYYTTNQDNNLVKATGLLMVPNTNYKLSTVVSTHGTTEGVQMVPSNLSLMIFFEIGFALNGYILMAPDYVGMGGGEGTHPYLNSDTEATATLDFIKAANKVIDQIGNIKRYDEYFLTGYSQGGHAAMATLKKASETNEIKFKYMYAGAGPFDVSYSTFQLGVMDKTIFPIPALPSYIVNMCKMTGYNVYNSSPAEIIAPAYLDDYTKNVTNRAGSLLWGNPVWREVFKPQFISSVTNNPNHPLKQCLKANDNYNWYNKTPSTLGYSDPDFIVNPNSTPKTESVQRGYYPFWDLSKYKIEKFWWGPLGHVGGIAPYILAANYKFNTLRSGGFFNQWAAIGSVFSKNTNDIQENPDIFRKSSIDMSFGDHIKVEQVYNFSTEKVSSQRFTENNISSLKDGVYLIKAKVNGKSQEIPFVKSTPAMVEYKEAVKDDSDHRLILNASPEDIAHINILKDNKIIKTVSSNEYKNNGISLTGYEYYDLIFEVVAKEYTVQFQKLSDKAIKSENINVVPNNSSLTIISDLPMKEVSVFDMNGRKVYNQSSVQSTRTQTNTLLKGVYIVTVLLDNGKTITKKVSL
ncbi:T9SS sorting signal type C domain-containing protein [Chryseobacterium sp.]|uniref:T9SS sorting signal type C domain-containing protein n=1 Tax=Chryseobacterium sp. TaxID=1871047 RepID=UPI0025B86194|nr:T9SS sorting signal type C domain-containing protein [Chryseobacterium sp.]